MKDVAGDRRLRGVRYFLLALLVGLLVHLVFGDNPWQDGIAKAARRGHPPSARDYAETYGWWIALGCAGLVATLLASARHWIGPPQPAECADLAPPRRGGRVVAAVAALAVLGAAALAAPRLSFPFWDDEQYTVRHHLDGRYEQRDDELVFRKRRWGDAWLYTLNRPNNHVPFTLLGKLSLGAWRTVAQPELRFANEAAVRAPAFAFGLAAIAATAWLLWRVGLFWAALFAPLFLAIHPWQLRYTSEARGYSLLLLCVPLLWGAAVGVVHRGSWRRWIAFGLAEVVLLWAYPGGSAIVGITNAGLLLELWRRQRGALRDPLTRFGVTSLGAAALFLLLHGANLLIFLWHTEWSHESIHWSYVRDVASHLWVGTSFAFRRLNEHYVELADVAQRAPGLFRVSVVASGALCVLGALRLGLRARLGWVLLAAAVLPAPLTILGAHLRQTEIHEWYVIFALPSVAILLGAGLEALGAAVRPARARAALTATLLLVYLGVYAWISSDVRAVVRSVPIQQTRAAVLMTRPDLDPFSEANREIFTVSWQRTPYYYDPNVHVIGRREQLLELLDQADRSGRELFINYGRPNLARGRFPELTELLKRDDLFEPVARFYGLEPRGQMLVYRYRRR
jgi:hypothetical protein